MRDLNELADAEPSGKSTCRIEVDTREYAPAVESLPRASKPTDSASSSHLTPILQAPAPLWWGVGLAEPG